MKRIVSFSGGVGSYLTAKRVIERYGVENTLLVFTDTKIEDPDLYRFMADAITFLGVEFIKVEEGRDVWTVFFDDKYIGNTRNGNCTRTLKQRPFREWLELNYKPGRPEEPEEWPEWEKDTREPCAVYLGFDWMEPHRFEKAKGHWGDYEIGAPMCEEPFLTKIDMFKEVERDGIELPFLYKKGFSHNNCGGFCVKAGHGHFKMLLEELPERYAYHEEKEQEWQRHTGKNNTILRDRKGNKTRPLSMKEFRERVEGQRPADQLTLDFDDFGGCGCFME